MRMKYAIVLLAGVAACAPPKTPSRTMEELLADPVELQAVVDRCDANPTRAATDLECANARRAVEKKAADEDAQKAVRKQAEFERLRAERRAQEDRQQQAAEAANKPFDPYATPVTPDPPAPKP